MATMTPARVLPGLALAATLAVVGAAPAAGATRTGVLRIAHGHEAGSWRSTHVARLGALRLDLRRAGDPGALAHRFGGRRVSVTGAVRGGVLRVRRIRRAGSAPARARAAHALSGPKKALVVLFGFSGGPAMTRTAAEARTAFFTGATSLRAYIEEISGGGATVTGLAGNSDGDVAGPFTISPAAGKAPSDGACQEFHWMDLADQQVAAAGTDVRQYDRVLYVSADAPPCAFAGEAPVSSRPLGTGTWIYLNGSLSTRVAAHEWGHTYGLMHAASTRCTSAGASVALSSSCTDTEYGDPFDTMGMGSARWFQAFNRVSLGYLPEATGVATASATGQYTIGALPRSSAAVRMLRVPRGDGTHLGLELRKPYGLFETWASSAAVVNGVTVRILPGSYACCDEPLTRLVDAHPQSTTFNDAPLAAGESLTDPLSGIAVSVAAVGSDSATVDVTYPGPAPGPGPTPDPPGPGPTPDPPDPGPTPDPDPDPGPVTPTPTPPPTPTSPTPVPPPTPAAPAAAHNTVATPLTPPALRVSLVRRAARSVLFRVRPGLAAPWTIRATVRRGGRTLAGRTIRNVRTAITTLALGSRSRLRGATLSVTVTSAAGRQLARRRL